MLAMDSNDNAGILNARGALRFFASMLAPAGGGVFLVCQRPASSCRLASV